MEAWQERTALLVGEENLERFKNATVAIVGLGGVGAYAAEMLVRAGIGKVVLSDSDVVGESNKNRQLLALDSTVGRPKVEVMSERLKDINPALEITGITEYLTEENISGIFDSLKIDYLVDAIDTLSPKLALIEYCVNKGLKFVSSMGSGAKYDIMKIRIADLSKSFNCPLAHTVRKQLRYRGISKGFPVVFSEELPDDKAVTPEESRNKKSQVGTISYLPAVFGCACAQCAILYLKEKL